MPTDHAADEDPRTDDEEVDGGPPQAPEEPVNDTEERYGEAESPA
jgi:hypothetical protein